MSTFQIKRGDTQPSMNEQLTWSDDTVEDLSPVGTVVYFHMQLSRDFKTKLNATPLTKTCVITDAVNGMVRVDWEVGDTDVKGKYVGEFEVVRSGYRVTFPNDGSWKPVEVFDDIADGA